MTGSDQGAPVRRRDAQAVVEVRNVSKRYGARGARRFGAVTEALRNVSLRVDAGEFVGIMGPSGSGKSTLLNCLATIDAPTGGQIVVGGRVTSDLRGRELARFRRDDLGFVFQDSNLLDTLTAYENIALALTIQKVPAREVDARVRAQARVLGIEEVLDKRPYQMSGGQRQRVAAARATVTRPRLVLADEPTGALDSRAARSLLDALARLNALGSTILMVTHDTVSASWCGRIVLLKDGAIAGELVRDGEDHAAFRRRIAAVVEAMGADADADAGEGADEECATCAGGEARRAC